MSDDDKDLDEFLNLVGSGDGGGDAHFWVCNRYLGDDDGEHCMTVLTGTSDRRCATCGGSQAICICPAAKGLCEGASCPRIRKIAERVARQIGGMLRRLSS
jgi:hypothetical protein